jgi:hypothetical protein
VPENNVEKYVMYQGTPLILESGEKGTITGCTGELKKSAEGKVWHVQRNAFDFGIGGGGRKQTNGSTVDTENF